jgi:hypothetical protein
MLRSISAPKENVQKEGMKERDVRWKNKQILRSDQSELRWTVLSLVVLGWLVPYPAFANPVPQTAEMQKVQAEKYEIEVRFEPEKGFLHSRATVTLRIEQKTETIEFELNPRLNILEVTDAQGRKLEFRRSGLLGSPKFQVWLAEAVAAGQEIKLTFVYEGTLPRGALDYITKGGILLRDESRWYPAVDLAAFTWNEITVRLPSGWHARATGIPEDPRAEGAIQIGRWITDGKVSSRSLVAYPKEEAFSVLLDAARETITASGKREHLLRGSADALNMFDKILGPYRFTGLHIQPGFPGQRGAIGYSAPGFMVVSEDVIKYHGYPGWAPEFLPHEIAHQWFPIEVTLNREEDGWLAESLAEYLAWRYLLENEPEQARRMVQRAMRDALAPDPLRPLALGLKLFREPWGVTHATLYQRGLLVWRTLETVIDRERVDLALREYYKRFAGRSASIADFRTICDEISGRDLGWFFEYFINGTQLPEISLRRLPSDAPNVLLGEIVVKNVPADFQVRVEMRIQTAKGAVEHSVATRGEVTPFSLNLPAAAMQVTLEPDMRLLRWTEAARNNREQLKLLAQIGEWESTGDFLRAVELCRSAIQLDPDDVAANQQQIRFVMGRMFYRAKKFTDAQREFGSALALASLDPMETDFYRAWAHVFRGRIANQRGQRAAAQKDARAGLASKSPAMESKIAWPEDSGRAMSAREALQALAGR